MKISALKRNNTHQKGGRHAVNTKCFVWRQNRAEAERRPADKANRQGQRKHSANTRDLRQTNRTKKAAKKRRTQVLKKTGFTTLVARFTGRVGKVDATAGTRAAQA